MGPLRGRGQCLELVHVDDQLVGRPEHEQFADELEVMLAERDVLARAVDRAARREERLVQAVQAGLRRAVRPEVLDELVTMQAVAIGEREQLDERARLTASPCAVNYLAAVDGDRESAERPKPEHLSHPISRR